MEQVKKPFVFSIPKNAMHFIRLLMAIYIACVHFVELSVITLDWMPAIIMNQGRIMILSFFIFSGFLVTGSYMRSDGLKNYLYNRILRLYPAYATILIVSILALSLMSTLSISDYFTDAHTLRYAVANFSLLNFIEPSLPGVFTHNPFSTAVNGSLWTLKVEMMFYLCLPLLLYFVKKQKNQRQRNWILFIAYCITYIYVYFIEHSSLIPSHLKQSFTLQFPGLINIFVVGVFMYFNMDWLQKNIKYLVIPAFILLLEKYFWNTYYITPIAIGLLVYFVSFKIPLLQKVKIKADFSYGIYIIHYPVVQTFIALGWIEKNATLSFIAYWIVILILSQCLWTFIEKPLMQKKR